MFEYGGIHLKTDHFKFSVSIETLFKCYIQLESLYISAKGISLRYLIEHSGMHLKTVCFEMHTMILKYL